MSGERCTIFLFACYFAFCPFSHHGSYDYHVDRLVLTVGMCERHGGLRLSIYLSAARLSVEFRYLVKMRHYQVYIPPRKCANACICISREISDTDALGRIKTQCYQNK